MSQPQPQGAFDPRYLIVLGAGATQFMIIGAIFAYGLFFSELEREFGWSRTVLSMGTSFAFLLMGVLAIFCGRLNERFGPRKILLVTGTLYGLGYIILSRITESWELVVYYTLFSAIGLGSHDVNTLSTVARWFDKRRGIMTALVKTGTACGQLTIPPLVAILIVTFGWRTSFAVMGVASMVLLWIAAIPMRLPPKPANEAAPLSGPSFEEARRTRAFWTLCFAQLLFFPTLVTVPTHIAVHGQDLGLNEARAALLLSVTAGLSILGRLMIGTLVDRLGSRSGYILCLTPLIISLVAYMLITRSELLYFAAALYGIGHGGLFTVVSPTIAECFGMRAHASVFGVVVFFGSVGGAGGPIAAGWIFDVTGSYTWAFAGLAGFATLALLLILSLKPNPQSA